MNRENVHNRITLPKVDGLVWREPVEVWSSTPHRTEPVHISLCLTYTDSNTDAPCYCDLLPSEARALAALLVMAADTQDRRISLQKKEALPTEANPIPQIKAGAALDTASAPTGEA